MNEARRSTECAVPRHGSRGGLLVDHPMPADNLHHFALLLGPLWIDLFQRGLDLLWRARAFGAELDLDELVDLELGVHLGKHSIVDAPVPDLHHSLERVRQGPQVAALFACYCVHRSGPYVLRYA